MAGLLCLWDRDLSSVKFDLVNFITHLWLIISQITGRYYSFQQSFPWDLLCVGYYALAQR